MSVKNWDQLVKLAAKSCLVKKLGNEYTKRLKFEIEEINKQGANSYWLRLFNSGEKFDHNKHGLVLPYLLGITKVDPIKEGIEHAIKFDPEFPDIDVDLLPISRDHIKKYAEETYGQEHVCNVGLWLTYKARLALQDAATVLGHNRHEIISALKGLPDEFDEMPFEEAYDEFEEVRELHTSKPEMVELAYKMLGKIKSQGKHAGGLIISAVPIREYIPLTLCGRDGNKQWTSAWTEGMAASQLSKFGFIKFDLLGLLNISYIYNCKKLVKKNQGIDIDFDDIDPILDKAGWIFYPDGRKEQIKLNDPETLKKANEIKLESIFQFDTDFAKSIVEKGGVKSFNDLLIYTSLGRPGPLPMIDVYIKNRDDQSKAWKNKLHPKMLDILGETQGVLTFQEQLLRLWVEVCGLTMPEAEKLQKAVKKKRSEYLEEMSPQVISGAAPVIGQEKAEELWEQMKSFGRYCFNKCLSADTVLTDPTNMKSLTVEELFQTKEKFHLLSYDGKNGFIDEIVDVHCNGEQEVFEIEFSNGEKQVTTIGHKFMNEFGDMEEVESLLKSGHAIKYIRSEVRENDIQENKRSDRKENCRSLSGAQNLQTDFGGDWNKAQPWDDNESYKETWSKKDIFNQSDEYCESQLFSRNRHPGESLLAGDVDRRWVYSRGKRICELAASSQGPKFSRAIWERFGFFEEDIDLSKRELQTRSKYSEQPKDGLGFKTPRRYTGEINAGNSECPVYVTSVEGADGWGRMHYGQFKRLSDDPDWIKFCLLEQNENHSCFRMWGEALKNHEISEQFLCYLLDWLITNQSDIEISLSRCNQISSTEKANGRCYISSIKNLGVKKTYSPEMKSRYHNYTISPSGGVIHANSHAVCYMIIAYRCLWLKTHFPAEWWAAVLSECPNTRTVQYMGAARSEGIEFGSINVNTLGISFSVDGDKVTPGVQSIKGIGKSVAQTLVEASDEGNFEDLDDFIARVGRNKTATERLIKLGGFDSFNKNRKALWMWYQYKYDNTREARKIKYRINQCYMWPKAKIDAERLRQENEYRKLYPKRNKIPNKILNWIPSSPRQDNPDPYDPEKELSDDETKMVKKINLSFEHILKLFPKNFTLKEILEFEKTYLGYYWNSPVDMFVHGTNTTIEDAKRTGILECVIEEAFVRQGARGDYMILNVTDGISSARINVWGPELLSNDEEVFEVGTGIKVKVNWQEKWRSFAVRRNSIIMPLLLKEDD